MMRYCKISSILFTAKNESFIISGHEKIVELLIQKGAHVDAKDVDKSTPLFTAVKYGM